MYYYAKRAMDFLASFFAIIFLSPLLILLSLAVKFSSKGPVLFKQKRVGKDNKYFMIWKFRTMRIDTPKDCPTHMLENPEQYITPVGKFLRKTSLDELPQLFNILVGQMSVIGPRPALWNQYDLLEERDKYGANNVRPGLTGWAQVKGRDELEISEKARFDGEYVEQLNQGFLKGLAMDIRCLFRTVTAVLKSEGVVEGGTGNMHEAVQKDKAEK